MDLTQAKVLITGGTSGIGYEIAKQMKAQGAQVVICGRNPERLAKAAEELNVIGIQADVSKEADVLRLVEAAHTSMNGLNVLINNAAYGYFSLLTEMNTKKFNALIATNLTGAMMVGCACAKIFTAANYGNIVNISSTAGNTGFASGTAYCATKFALKGMTECWRQELRKHNIRVMLVNPSEVQTDFIPNSGRPPRPKNDSKLESEEIAHLVLSMLTMRDRGFITEATVFATNPIG